MLRTEEHEPVSPERYLLLDEWAESIVETERDKPGFGMHRYQRIWAVRGDRLCVFEKEMGPVTAFHGAHLLNFWAAGLYRVGEVMEIAERLREGRPPERTEPSNLMGQYRNELEEKRDLRAHRTTSGPHVTIVRN